MILLTLQNYRRRWVIACAADRRAPSRPYNPNKMLIACVSATHRPFCLHALHVQWIGESINRGVCELVTFFSVGAAIVFGKTGQWVTRIVNTQLKKPLMPTLTNYLRKPLYKIHIFLSHHSLIKSKLSKKSEFSDFFSESMLSFPFFVIFVFYWRRQDVSFSPKFFIPE